MPLNDVEAAAVQILVDRSLTDKVNEINRSFNRSEVTNLHRLLEVLDQDAADRIGKFRRELAFLEDEIRIKWNKMGKLQTVAERIRDTKKKWEAEADKLSAKLDTLDAKAPDTFARGNAVIDQHNADLDSMDAELRQLSNLPLEQS